MTSENVVIVAMIAVRLWYNTNPLHGFKQSLMKW